MTDGVRRAELADARACAAIVHGWVSATSWMPQVHPSLDEFLEMFRTAIPKTQIWVSGAQVDAYLSFDPQEALIRGLYSAAPGAGHGKRLVDHVKSGRDFVQLWTHEPNTSAHRFYHREGFKTVERLAEGRGDGLPELRMEWYRGAQT